MASSRQQLAIFSPACLPAQSGDVTRHSPSAYFGNKPLHKAELASLHADPIIVTFDLQTPSSKVSNKSV